MGAAPAYKGTLGSQQVEGRHSSILVMSLFKRDCPVSTVCTSRLGVLRRLPEYTVQQLLPIMQLVEAEIMVLQRWEVLE